MGRRASATNSTRMKAAARREAVLCLRFESRMGEQAIADRVGISQQRVSQILREYLQKSQKRRLELADQILDDELASIDIVCKTCANIMRNVKSSPSVQLQAADRLFRAGERRSKLLGLEVQRTEVSIRREPLTQEELELFQKTATAQELEKVRAGDWDVALAVLERAGVQLQEARA